MICDSQIGLAVGDIQMVLKNAKLKRLAMQVAYHTELEQRWVPKWLLKRTHHSELKFYPNRQKYTGALPTYAGLPK